MAELKLERKGLKVIFEGQEYNLRKPALSAIMSMDDEADDKARVTRMVDIIVDCGMPKDVVLGLDSELLGELIGALQAEKK